MLFEELTTGAIVAGVVVDHHGKWSASDAEDVRSAIAANNQERDTALKMYVPADSATDHIHDPAMDLYGDSVIIGVAPEVANPWDGPKEVDVAAVQKALAEVEELPDSLWQELAGRHELLAGVAGKTPELAFMSYGPLAEARLVAGRIHPSSDSDDTVYEFHSVQDMDQRWHDQGVDGIAIEHAEFSDIWPVDMSDDAVAGWLEKVDKLDEPKIYITVRYD